MRSTATNRQKKVLRFFGVQFHTSLTAGAAGWEIGTLFADENNAEKWRRYLYLTGDFGAESDALLPYEESALETINVPEDWSAENAVQAFRDEIAAQILASETPYDPPPPDVEVVGHSFCFTGKLEFGTRKEIEALVKEKHLAALATTTRNQSRSKIGWLCAGRVTIRLRKTRFDNRKELCVAPPNRRLPKRVVRGCGHSVSASR